MTPRETAIILNLIPGLGPTGARRLMQTFASPELILEAPAAMLARVKGISPAQARNITEWKSIVNLHREMELAEQAGADITTIFDNHYPQPLRNLYAPPLALYSWGAWTKTDTERSLAIVGSRMATHYGRLCAKNTSSQLAEAGVTIISGLARGIDTAAHEGALDAKGRTIAVVGAGLNRLYPEENRPLAQRIAQGRGAVISEFPMNMPPSRATFPMRNRIVGGWGCATLVVEASARSGALITARLAAEQGKEVFCIPGPVDRHSSDGCHALIRDGATLATGSADILHDMKWENPVQNLPLFSSHPCSPSAHTIPLTREEEHLLQSIRQGFNTIDALCAAEGRPAPDITARLAKLQIAGRITPDTGGYFTISP